MTRVELLRPSSRQWRGIPGGSNSRERLVLGTTQLPRLLAEKGMPHQLLDAEPLLRIRTATRLHKGPRGCRDFTVNAAIYTQTSVVPGRGIGTRINHGDHERSERAIRHKSYCEISSGPWEQANHSFVSWNSACCMSPLGRTEVNLVNPDLALDWRDASCETSMMRNSEQTAPPCYW